MSIFKTNVSIENIQLDMLMTNDSFCSQGANSSDFHSHAHYELHYITSGSFSFKIGNQKYTFDENTLVLIAPKTYHRIYNDSLENSGTKISFELFITKSNKGKNLFDVYFPAFSNINEYIAIKTYLYEFYELQNAIRMCKGSELVYRINSLVTLIFFKMHDLICPQEDHKTVATDEMSYAPTEDDYIMISEILGFVSKYHTKPYTVSDYAKELHMSEKQINRITQKFMNSSLLGLVNSFKIKKAQTLIEEAVLNDESENTLTNISLSVGFQNYNYFYNQFKKYTGITPTGYINKLKNK